MNVSLFLLVAQEKIVNQFSKKEKVMSMIMNVCLKKIKCTNQGCIIECFRVDYQQHYSNRDAYFM